MDGFADLLAQTQPGGCARLRLQLGIAGSADRLLQQEEDQQRDDESRNGRDVKRHAPAKSRANRLAHEDANRRANGNGDIEEAEDQSDDGAEGEDAPAPGLLLAGGLRQGGRAGAFCGS